VLNYVKTKAKVLLQSETGAVTTEYAIIVVAMFIVVLPSVFILANAIQKLFVGIAALLNR
jgi:Flp pilus assembly pilin Flp